LYKTNLSDYRQRIRCILNFAIGAETSQILENKLLKTKLQKELDELRENQDYNIKQKKRILENNSHILLKAVEAGLLPSTEIHIDKKLTESAMLALYKKLSKKTIADVHLDTDSQNRLSEQINFLEKQLKPIYEEIRDLNLNRNNLVAIINLNKEQQSLLESKKERLEISGFLKDYFEDNIQDVFTKEELENLCNKLEETELDLSLKTLEGKNSEYIRKKDKIDEDIASKSRKINELISRKNDLISNKEEFSLLEKFYVRIILTAKNVVEEYNQRETSLSDQIKSLENQIRNLKIKNKEKEYLENIVKEAQNYLPSFAEFKFIDSFDPKELAVKIKESPLAIPFYASEAGSGANWVAYHIAMMLGFHKHFIDKDTAVFNFLIFDQPSQVYFPKSRYNEDGIQIFDKDAEDTIAVKEMFEIMQKAVDDNKGNLQILVLDHAAQDIWGDIKNIHEVDEWTGDKALIPKIWYDEVVS
jgi:DNA repair exonuclease SbcCD ATPase subunit